MFWTRIALSAGLFGCLVSCKPSESHSVTEAAQSPTTAGTAGAGTSTSVLTDQRLISLQQLLPEGYTLNRPSPKPIMNSGMLFLKRTEQILDGNITARVMFGQCMGAVCRPMELSAWETEKSTLPHTHLFPSGLDASSLTHDLELTELGTRKAVVAYVFYWHRTSTDGRNSTGGMHRCMLYMNDTKRYVSVALDVHGRSLGESPDEYRGQLTKAMLTEEVKHIANTYLGTF